MSPPEMTRLTPGRRAWAWPFIGIGISAYALFAVLSLEPAAFVPMALVVLGVTAVSTAVAPVPTLAAVTAVVGAASLPLGAQGLDLGVRVYPLDFLLAALIAGTLLGRLANPTLWRHQWPLRLAFVVFLAYLGLSLLHGLAAGHGLRDALGDFRRMAVYPVALFVLAAGIWSPKAIETMLRAIVWASYATVGIAMVRVVTGVGYAEEHLAGTTIRYLSYVEASTAGLGVLVLLGFARAATGPARLTNALAALPPFIALLVSNYRTAWLALGLGLLVTFGSLGWRRGLTVAALGALLLAPVGYLLIAYTQLGQTILDRFNPFNAATSGLWRYFSWFAALKAWLAGPWLGTGLGYAHHFEFFDIYSGTYAASTTSSIHNDPLWFLVNNGLVGLAAAAVFLVPWFRRAWALARAGSPFERQVGSTSLGSLALMVTVSCLQPFFSTAGTTLIAMVFVAIVLRTTPQSAGADAG